MEVSGYALINSSGAAVARWPQIPARIEFGGLRVDGAAVGWENEEYSVEAYAWEEADPAEPEPGTTPPVLVASAFNVNIESGDISSIGGIFNVAAAIYFGVGQYMLLFLSPQPDDNYFVTIAGGAPCMAVAEKNSEYLIIEAKDAVGGNSVDPAQFGVQVYRT